jgi:ABC-2 type transport system ATP-binding protein
MGVLDEEVVDWFVARGPGDLVGQITAPTLLVHGTVDNLFTPSEGATNFQALQDAGTPVAMLWFCGGHGICLTGEGDSELVNAHPCLARPLPQGRRRGRHRSGRS